jgi:hypothetical protein
VRKTTGTGRAASIVSATSVANSCGGRNKINTDANSCADVEKSRNDLAHCRAPAGSACSIAAAPPQLLRSSASTDRSPGRCRATTPSTWARVIVTRAAAPSVVSEPGCAEVRELEQPAADPTKNVAVAAIAIVRVNPRNFRERR